MNHRWRHWLDGIAEAMQVRAAASPESAARTVVLMPYAQLMPLANRLWAARHPDGFAPRFETTQNWAWTLAGVGAAGRDEGQGAADLRFKPALDALTAHILLEQAGLGAHAAVAAPLLLEAAQQLAPLAAARPPEQRADWGQQMRHAVQLGMEGSAALQIESAVAQIALAWVVNSSYGSDVFYSSGVLAATDCLLVLPGLQPDPLMDGLRPLWGERLHMLKAPTEFAVVSEQDGRDTALGFHEAADAAQEAEWAAACVLRHLEAGRSPVAVAVIDRALTRRLRAMLAGHGVQMRDETGWKLSTTRAGAQIMTALRACAWSASSDAVLDWLKHAPACDEIRLRALEAALRRQPQRLWRHAWTGLTGRSGKEGQGQDDLPTTVQEIETWRALLGAGKSGRTLQEWLEALQSLLLASGAWQVLEQDDAGIEVLRALHYADAQTDVPGQALESLQAAQSARPVQLPARTLWAQRRWSLAEFTQWVDRALEAAIFKPPYPAQEQVVLLPLAQMLGRDFAAIVLPGCDERSLSAAPEPTGLWTAAQRTALGLPTREQLQAAQRAAWDEAVSRACPVDVFWRRSDADGEPLLASPLVRQSLPPTWAAENDESLLDRRMLTSNLGSRPEPRWLAPWAPALLPQRISASAYQDLRHCPYRFHALRLLGLREVEEIEGEIDKRDFGLWLHAVLQAFHVDADAAVDPTREQRRARIDAIAESTAREQRLAEDEFLPFQTAWPRVREGYLDWLEKHEAEGWRFAAGERDARQELGDLRLEGRIDRIDRHAGAVMVIDYKTEAAQTTSLRIRDPLEDTQLAFYAALLSEDAPAAEGSEEAGEGRLRAAYVNVGESETRVYEQKDVAWARDALVEGMLDELGRIAQGAPLPALGDGKVCETCAARGLCRKDFWNE